MLLIIEDKKIKPIEVTMNVVGDLELKLDKSSIRFFYEWLMESIGNRGILKPKIEYVKQIILIDPFSNYRSFENAMMATLSEEEGYYFNVRIIYDYYRDLEKDEIRELKLKELLDEETY